MAHNVHNASCTDSVCNAITLRTHMMEYSEYKQQTLRLGNDMEEMTIAMIKMNIKLPRPTMRREVPTIQ
eukprot:1128858-Amphidinium_carterae.1